MQNSQAYPLSINQNFDQYGKHITNKLNIYTNVNVNVDLLYFSASATQKPLQG